MAITSPVGCSNRVSCSFLSRFNSTLSACSCLILYYAIHVCAYGNGLKAGSMYALNKGYAFNNRVHLTTRVYGIIHCSCQMNPLSCQTEERRMGKPKNNSGKRECHPPVEDTPSRVILQLLAVFALQSAIAVEKQVTWEQLQKQTTKAMQVQPCD